MMGLWREALLAIPSFTVMEYINSERPDLISHPMVGSMTMFALSTANNDCLLRVLRLYLF